MQDTGAFKLRGAANKIISLFETDKPDGLITVSSGNHGRAVAYVAKQLGTTATVCITSLVPENKIAGLRMFGANIVIHGDDQNEAEQRAIELATQQGLAFIPPFDDPHVIAGQGTIGLEMLEAQPELETLLIPLSGGGLISGIAIAAKALKPSIRIIGVSTQEGAAMHASLKAGHIVPMEEQVSVADALPGPIQESNAYTFRICQSLVDETIQVSETQIEAAMAYLMRYEKLIVEGAAAVGVAALLGKLSKRDLGPTATVLTGDNINIEKALDTFSRVENNGKY